LDDNTLVIFTSDNGGLSTAEGSPTVNGPLRAGKGWLYEGGIRVPFIVYWKGKVQENLTSEMPITVADIFPTIAKAANEKYRKDASVDGKNIFELLADNAAANNRPLFWHYPHYSNQGGKPGAAIRQGNWKLIYHYEDESAELYNLKQDVREQKDLSTTETETAARLKTKLQQWLANSNASYPQNNKDYRPIGGAIKSEER
jgi:arylsulfatase A-like enzyme